LVLGLVVLPPFLASRTRSQTNPTAGTPSADATLGSPRPAPAADAHTSFLGTFQKLWTACKEFAYPIGFVFIAGVFLGLDRWRVLILDKVRSRGILERDLRRLNESEHQLLLAGTKPSRLVDLLRTIQTMKKGMIGDQEIKDEIHRRVALHEGKFSTFMAWMEFLSDSEGALGLLGTVAGIYGAFTTKALASANTNLLLEQLGLALATTYLGLVASLILNLITTQVSNVHTGAMAVLVEKGEEYLNSFEAANRQAAGPAA
jgi:biopolymer transport protein ExbB/TolQ